MRTWGGRFAEDPDKDVADFTRSIEIDEALAFDDISGSIAHVRGLGRAGVLGEDEVHALGRRSRRARRGRRRGSADVGPGSRGHPHEPRGRAREQDRALGRASPYRPVPERSGRHGPATLDAPGHRSTSTLDWSPSNVPSSASPSRKATPCCRGRRTSSPPSRSCSRITCLPTSRWRSGTAAVLAMRAVA